MEYIKVKYCYNYISIDNVYIIINLFINSTNKCICNFKEFMI